MKDIERRKKVRVIRKKRKRRFVFLIIFIPLVVFLINKSEILNINEIVINNNNNVEKNDILLISGIEEGENIFSVAVDKASRNINSIPYIEVAHVNRELPNKIIIDVLEREEKMQIFIGGKYQIIGRYGFVLSEIDEADPDLLILENISNKKFEVGSNIYKELGSDEIRDFFNEINDLNLFTRINSINFDDKDDIRILKGEKEIHFGDLNDSKYKVKLLNEVLIDIEDKGLDYKEIIMNRGENPIIILNEGNGD